MKFLLIWYEEGHSRIYGICLECQKVKAKHQNSGGYFYPHDVPTQKWQVILMDFIIIILKIRLYHDTILVVVDRLTKVAYFIPGNTIDDAPTMENKFPHDIFILHGFPKEIISDRDSKFTIIFQKLLHKELEIKLNMNSTYHPKINGKIEHVNRVLEDMLKMYQMK